MWTRFDVRPGVLPYKTRGFLGLDGHSCLLLLGQQSHWDPDAHDAPTQVAVSCDEYHATPGRQVNFKDRDTQDAPTQVAVSRDECHATPGKQVKFKDPVSSSEVCGAAAEGQYHENDDASTWNSGTSPYSNTIEDPSFSYSCLQPVPEEPSSSFSEAAADDPLPAIEDLHISGNLILGERSKRVAFLQTEQSAATLSGRAWKMDV